MSEVRIFISHSAVDVEYADGLIQVLEKSLVVSQNSIRCTSVPGYRLKPGAVTASELREEINESAVIIGVLTPSSMGSAWPLFELGAAWGSFKEPIPVLAGALEYEDIKGPLGATSALRLEDRDDLWLLVDSVAARLGLKRRPAELGANAIDALLARVKPASAKPGRGGRAIAEPVFAHPRSGGSQSPARPTLEEIESGIVAGPIFRECFDAAERRIDLLALTCRVPIRTYGESFFLNKLFDSFCEIRILITDPASGMIEARAEDETDKDPAKLRGDTEKTIEFFEKLAKKRKTKYCDRKTHGAIHVRLSRGIPYFGYTRIDDKCFFTPYLADASGVHSALLKIEDPRSVLFRGLRRHFDILWERSTLR